MNLRIVDTGRMQARWNVAMTAALVEMHGARRIPDTLRFHRYPESVLVGRHQALSQAADVARCRAGGVELARRLTGGGAVYMAPGALAWDIVASRAAFGHRLDQVAETFCGAVASGLSRLGVPARYRPQNDIEADGRKICGSSGYFDGPTLVYQGTILIDADLEDMARLLRLPPGSERRTTTIADVLGRTPDPCEIQGVVATALAGASGCTPDHAALSVEELSLADRLHREEFGRDAFVEAGEATVPADAAAARWMPGAEARVS